MREIKNRIPSLSTDDVLAILHALPLVNLYEAEDPGQQHRNFVAVESAMNKFQLKGRQFNANELRVTYIGIRLALDYLSSRIDGSFDITGIDAEWRADLSKYLFTYNRLLPKFEELIHQIAALQTDSHQT